MATPRALRLVPEPQALGRLRLLNNALFENLLDDGIVDARAKLVFEHTLGGRVKGSLISLAVRREDLKSRDKVREWHGGVIEPLLVVFDVVDKDDKVLVGALVVDRCLCSIATSHCQIVGESKIVDGRML